MSDPYPPVRAEGERQRVETHDAGSSKLRARVDTMGLMGRTAVSVRGFDPSAIPVVGRTLDRLTIWDEAVRRRWPFSALVGPDLEPGAVQGDGSRLLVRPAILGFIAVSAIMLGSVPQGSPFVLKMPGAWFFGVPAAGTTTKAPLNFLALVAMYGGLVLFMRVWYGLIRTLSQVKGVPVRKLVMVLALWIAPLLLAPPLFSRDIYSYAAQGEMMSHHISPYHYGPGVLGATPSETLVDPLWKNTPVPYGPLFMETDGFLTSASGHNELVDLALLRLLALVGVGLMAMSIPSLARSLGRDPSYAFTMAVLNPVTILHLVGGAHNDALMLGLLMAGLAVARRGRPVAGIVLCALAAAVKVPAALGVIYIGWDWLGTGLPVRARIRPVVTAGLIATAVMGALSIITGLGWSWVLNLSTPGTVRSWVAPATGAGILVTDVAHLVGIGVSLHTTLSMTRGLGVLVACAAGVVLLLRSDRIGALRAMGMTMLIIVALGPVVQPWYLSWGLVVLAPVATGKVRTLIVGSSIVAAFIGLPAGRQLVSGLFKADPLTVAVALLVCLAILTLPLSPFDRERLLARWRRRGDGGPPTELEEPAVSLGYAEA